MVDEKQIMISVIIPVYNSEKYLRKCIDSVLAQSYTNFELILVNDGSTDGSGKICDEYAEKDERVRVFHKDNGGVSDARNRGIENARGEWIAFVDSDDWVNNNYLKELFDDSEEIDFVIHGDLGNSTIYNSFKNEIQFIDIVNKNEVFEDLKLSRNGYPVSKLYKFDIINNAGVKFPLGINLNEDTMFVMQYASKCNKILYRNKMNYIYQNNIDGSLSNQSKLNFKSSSLALKRINEIIINDFDITNLTKFPTLRTTVLGFLNNSIRALYKNQYKRLDRIASYKELHTYLKVEIGTYNSKANIFYKLFMNKMFWLNDAFLFFLYKTQLNTLYVKFKNLYT